MKSLARSSRANSALEVVQHMNDGLSISEACRMVGMARSSFYSFMKTNPEIAAEIQGIIEVSRREQLGMILASKTEILRKVIEAGLAEETKPKDRLAIFMKLSELQESMTKGLGYESEVEKRAREFLSQGPNLVQAKSRFTATERTVTIETDSQAGQICTERY